MNMETDVYIKCVNDAGKVIATYRCSNMALKKDGELTIFPVSTLSHDIKRQPRMAFRTEHNVAEPLL